MDLLGAFLDPEIIKNLLGDALSSEFMKTCSIFALAALIHAKQMRKEIRTQVGLLIDVIRQDLDSHRELIGTLRSRVDKLEQHLKRKE